MDRGAWQVTVHGVAKSWPQLSTQAWGEKERASGGKKGRGKLAEGKGRGKVDRRGRRNRTGSAHVV